MNYQSIEAAIQVDPKGTSLAITIQMDPFPEAELPDLTIKNDLEKRFVKSFPQFSVYRQLAEFSAKYKIDPVNIINGDLIDFRDLTEEDWQVAKHSFLLYMKVRLDIIDDCTFVQLDPLLPFF